MAVTTLDPLVLNHQLEAWQPNDVLIAVTFALAQHCKAPRLDTDHTDTATAHWMRNSWQLVGTATEIK